MTKQEIQKELKTLKEKLIKDRESMIRGINFLTDANLNAIEKLEKELLNSLKPITYIRTK